MKGVRREDGGVYGCTAGNMGGLVRAEISVSVTGESSGVIQVSVSCIIFFQILLRNHKFSTRKGSLIFFLKIKENLQKVNFFVQ